MARPTEPRFTVSAWYAGAAVEQDAVVPDRHALKILGAYSEFIEVRGTRAELLEFADKVRYLVTTLPEEA